MTRAVGMLGMFGIKEKDGRKMIDGLVNFPKQIASINVVFPEDMKMGIKGKSLSISLTGVPQSWLGRVIASAEPSPQGAPVLPAKDPVMSVSMAFKAGGMVALMKPFFDIMATLGAKGAEEQKKIAGMLNTMTESMDGSMTMVGDPFTPSMMTVTGVKDGGKVAELIHGDAYAKFQEKLLSLIPMADIEVEPKALVHREYPGLQDDDGDEMLAWGRKRRSPTTPLPATTWFLTRVKKRAASRS